jgi:hypothetical protein
LLPIWIENMDTRVRSTLTSTETIVTHPKGNRLMAVDLAATPDRNESVVSRDGSNRSPGCTPSELIVRYFLDVLSPTEKTDLADHLTACDFCSAKLLAVEISAQVSLPTVAARSDFAAAEWEPANASDPARKAAAERTNRRRSRRTAALTVVTLDDRELMTTMGLALALEAQVRVAVIEPLETAVTFVPVDAPRHESSGRSGGALLNSCLWDLAIDHLVGSASFDPVFLASAVPNAAA